MRIIAPRSTADALIWLGASKCGSSRRYAFTLEFNSRQISLPCVRMRSMNCQANLLIFSSPFSDPRRGSCRSWITETLVCMPLPFTPTTGLGRKLAVIPMLLATWRQISL
jgi:hypothetical protein